MMNMQELATAAYYDIPVKIFMLNNNYLGMVRQWQELFLGKRYSQTHFEKKPDFVKLAEAMQVRGAAVSNPAELDNAIKATLAEEGPAFLMIGVDEEENVFPMIPPGKGHNEVVLRGEI